MSSSKWGVSSACGWLVRVGFLQRVAMGLFSLAFGISAVAEAQSPQTRAEYRLNAGDALDVFVWGEEKLQREVRILPDGTFAFPLAGTIQAEGRTAREVGAEIQKRVQSYFRAGTPEVTVSVKDTSGLRFYVVGKVRSPGSYSVGRSINALQALSLAGGPSEFANVDQAMILHETREGQTAERVSLSEVLRGARGLAPGEQSRPIPVLRSGDVLVIP